MSKKNTPLSFGLAACLLSSGTGSAGLQLLPAGSFNTPEGKASLKGSGPWLLNDDIAKALISALSTRKNPILIDYEHQSLLAAENGKPVPAAGWIEPGGIVFNENGLFATDFKWTAAAASSIEADEYRYLSAVFNYDKSTGAVLDIHSVALTNTPALDGLQAVTLAAASIKLNYQENPVDEIKERLRYLFNIPLLATDAEIVAQLDRAKNLISSGGAALSGGINEVLTKAGADLAALTAANTQIAALTAAQDELAALKAANKERDINDTIQAALSESKLLPSQVEWATNLAKTDLALLTGFLATAQPIAALAGNQTDGIDFGGGQTQAEAHSPNGYEIDTARLKDHQAALNYQQKNGCDYLAALKAVGVK